MRGDFVLYEAKPGSLPDWLVARFTGGPYVHVEIDLGNGLFVGEHGAGITVHKIDAGRGSAFVTPVSTEPGGIEAGMQWVEKVIEEQQKNPASHTYGWLDIAVDVAKIVGAKLTFQKSGAWDCSHFVALYLQVAFAAGPLGKLLDSPESISPNDLARAFGVLK
jgi:hypothetical protein